jgi:hypothetical protein
MHLAIVRLEIPGFPFLKKRLCKLYKLGLGPPLKVGGADVNTILCDASEKGFSLGLRRSAMPVVNESMDILVVLCQRHHRQNRQD